MKNAVHKYLLRERLKSCLSFLKTETPHDRYLLFLRGNFLVFIGYIIATIETHSAIYYGLTDLTYNKTFFISSCVLLLTMIFTLITYVTKIRYVWYELAIFIAYLSTFLAAFCIWVFWLGEMRFLGILNGFTAVTIVLSYTNALQSLSMSISTLVCYYSVVWYSIKIAGQPGSLERETFFALCLIPAFILISVAAYYMNKRRRDLKRARNGLQILYNELSTANNRLVNEQHLTEIEMNLANEIQSAIFPRKVPEISDWDIAFVTKPYGAVSGDFYDFYSKGDSLKGVSLFDVSGHGVAAALITILAKPVIYTYFNNSGSSDLGDVLEYANSDLFDQLEEVNLYITGLLLRMKDNNVEYVNAGHPDILWYQQSEKKVSVIGDSSDSFKGHPIGITQNKKKYISLKFSVNKGDYLVLYSDGLIESRNDEGYQFGIPRLSDAFLSFSGDTAESLLDHIVNSLDSFAGDTRQGDDITIIVARKT